MIFNDPELNLRAEYSLFDRQTGRLIARVMVKAVSDLDKMGLNNIHVHHLIYAHWHKVDSVSLMAGCMSIWMNQMSLVHSSLEPQALIVFGLWQHHSVITMRHRVTYCPVYHCN